MRVKRVFSAGAVLALVGMMGTATTAFAGDIAPVNPKAEGSINIHKFEQPSAQGSRADGTVQNTTGLTALNGINFTIQKVDCVDLTTNAGWKKAADMVADLNGSSDKSAWTPGDGCGLSGKQTKTTGADGAEDGDALFTKLPVGQYLVTESLPEGSDLNVKTAPPFLVTVPLASPTDGSWNYNVHVYPKNTVSSINKTSDDSALVKVGDQVTFAITSSIPGGVLTKYVVTDPLHPGLTYQSLSAAIVSGGQSAELVQGDGVGCANNCDYYVTQEAGDQVGTLGRQNVVNIVFTAAGIAKLSAALTATPGAEVKTTIVASLNVKGVGGVTNEASYTIDNGNGDHSVGTGVGGKVDVKMGAKAFKKVNEKGANLAGAKFAVYWTSTPQFSNSNRVTGLEGMNGDNVLTSGADGTLSAEGLRYTDWASNGQLTCDDDSSTGTVSAGCRYYWLVETDAPGGYLPLAAPVMFKVNATGTETKIVNVSTDSITGTLPHTGMSGIILMVLIGGVVLSGAGYGMYRVSRTKA